MFRKLGFVPCLHCDDCHVRRGALSDGHWAVLGPLLPVTVVGRPSLGRRLIDGIRWRVRTGAPWRDLPPEYGPRQTVFGLFRRWPARWRLVSGPVQAAGPCGRRRSDHMGRERRLHDLPRPSARCRRPARRLGSERTPWRSPGRARRRWPGPVPWGLDHEDSPGLRARAEAVVCTGHRGPAGRQSAVHSRAGGNSGSPSRPGSAAGSSVAGTGRQGVLVAGEPRVSASARDPMHHPGTRRSGRAPQAPGEGWRAASDL